MFAALSENPEFYRDKMKLFVAIAPTVRISNLASNYGSALFYN